jgi:hypothetical protein
MEHDCWRLTQELLDRCQSGEDQRLQAMAHLGAAVILFERCGDGEMVAAVLRTVERATGPAEALRLS